MKDNKRKKTIQKLDGDNVTIITSDICNMYTFTRLVLFNLDVSDILDV